MSHILSGSTHFRIEPIVRLNAQKSEKKRPLKNT